MLLAVRPGAPSSFLLLCEKKGGKVSDFFALSPRIHHIGRADGRDGLASLQTHQVDIVFHDRHDARRVLGRCMAHLHQGLKRT